MIRVFDCSNSNERPFSRKLGGPIINEFVGLLHKYCSVYDCQFVKSLQEADVAFTNDIFPQYVLDSKVKLIKRMDGVHWQSNLIERNLPYIEACTKANHVIFISNYSRDSFKKMYGGYEIKQYSIKHHWTDVLSEVTNNKEVDVPTVFYSIATDWSRPEKRLSEIIRFVELFPEVKVHLAGTCVKDLPPSIIKYGYLDSGGFEFKNIITKSHAMLNLTCKDAATKTVCTAINNGLPVLYAGSGGVGELVGEFGQHIIEADNIQKYDYIPGLDNFNMENGYQQFKNKYTAIKNKINSTNKKDILNLALKGYFDVMKGIYYEIRN